MGGLFLPKQLGADMALSLTTQNGAPFPGRDLILFLTFIVILAMLVVQGLSLPPLIRWLAVKDDGSLEKRNARPGSKPINPLSPGSPKSRKRTLRKSDGTSLRRFSSEYERLSYLALDQERRTIIQLRNENVISDEILRRIQRDIALAEARLLSHR